MAKLGSNQSLSLAQNLIKVEMKADLKGRHRCLGCKQTQMHFYSSILIRIRPLHFDFITPQQARQRESIIHIKQVEAKIHNFHMHRIFKPKQSNDPEIPQSRILSGHLAFTTQLWFAS